MNAYTGDVIMVPKPYYDALVDLSMVLQAELAWTPSVERALLYVQRSVPSSPPGDHPQERESAPAPEQGPRDHPLAGLGRERDGRDDGSGLLHAPPLEAEFSFPLHYANRLLDGSLSPAQRELYQRAVGRIERPPQGLQEELRSALTKVAQERAGIVDAFLAAIIATQDNWVNPIEFTLVESQKFEGDRLVIRYHLERIFSRGL